MQHPREPFSSDDPADGEFSRPRSSPQPPTGRAAGLPLPAPAAPPAPLIPPETHHDEAGAPPPVPAAPAEPPAEPDLPAEPDVPVEPGFPPDSQVLFESWEPPFELDDPWWDVPLPPEFGDVPVEAMAGRAGTRTGPPPPRGPGSGPRHRPGGPYWEGPRHARAVRGRDRGHFGGVILALTGALALAGAIPLGILGVRTLSGQPTPVVSTAPMADGSQIKAPATAPAAAPSQLGHGQTAMGPGPSASSSPAASSSPSAGAASSGAAGGAMSGVASGAKTVALTAGPGCGSVSGVIVFPFHAPTGDGWTPATAKRSGPCGTSFTYSLLANVKDASGDWHDHYAWIFSTGRKVASCTMSFYIPPSAHANSSAFYWISTGSDNPQNRMADFSIDQQASQGQWVTKGPLTFPGGTVLVELTDRGVGPVQDSVEAGVVQLRCV
jgi:hypothetical protein